MQISRLYTLPKKSSFFLFGPRGVGKSTYIKDVVEFDFEIDLLNHGDFIELQRDPSRLEAKTAHLLAGNRVFIDEIQKLPELLDEVHRLHEKRKLEFILTGSSARKLKRAGANLLAGRALTYKMYPFSFKELENAYHFSHLAQWGSLPVVLQNSDEAPERLSAYVETYLKEEIQAEALVRRLEVFSRFLEIAGQLNGQVLNLENIGRETGRKSPTIQSWYTILEETLLGSFLPPFRPGFKVREAGHPKFYWVDPGVARAAAGLLRESVDVLWLGAAFENLVLNELRIYNEISRKQFPLYYYGTPGAGEIDFIVQTQKKRPQRPGKHVSIEVKWTNRWKREFEAPSRALKEVAKGAHERMIGVYTGKQRLAFDGFEVFPFEAFVTELYEGKIV